jgi:endonuclease G, mitochondrial
VGFGAGTAAAYWLLRHPRLGPAHEKEKSAGGIEPIGLSQHPALKHGMPKADRLCMYSNFVVSFDTRLRNPKWVVEHITSNDGSRRGNRKNSAFCEDDGLDERFRSRLSDYRGSGFDRGHMAPAANHKHSQDTMDETFTLSNTCPQVGPGFNRDYWARFERFVYDLTETCSDVWVVTGPLYLPGKKPDGCWIMEHQMLGEEAPDDVLTYLLTYLLGLSRRTVVL